MSQTSRAPDTSPANLHARHLFTPTHENPPNPSFRNGDRGDFRGKPLHPYFLLLMILTGIAAISSASILIRLCAAPPLTIATYRVTLAALVVSPFCAFRRSAGRPNWSAGLVLVTVTSGIFLALHFVFWINSLSFTSVASSATLVSTTPLFVATFGYCALGERPGRKLLPGILMALLGSAMVAGLDYSFSPEGLQGDALALMGAVMAAGYLIAGRFSRLRMDLATYTLVAYGTAALALLAASSLAQIPLWGFTEETYLYLVLIGLIPQLIGHTTFNWALRFLSPTQVSILILGEPIGATFLAYVLLGETFSPGSGAGLIVLASGILLSSLSMPRQSSGTGGDVSHP